MKHLLASLILTSLLLFSCAPTKTKEDTILKSKLTGSWSGFEKDNQKEGLTKYWIQNRNENGTFVLLFTAIDNCEAESHIEKGTWWIKDGVFYEKFDNDNKIDAYTIEKVDRNSVKFKAKKLSLDFNNKDYEFYETREY